MSLSFGYAALPDEHLQHGTGSMMADLAEQLYDKIKRLNESLWERRTTRPAVDEWLENFSGSYVSQDKERLHALYLLSKFLFIGHDEVRQLLRSLFQDLVRHPLTVGVRMNMADKQDFDAIHDGLKDEISKTRFLGIGGAAESGAHLLYEFRHANDLPDFLFINSDQVATAGLSRPKNQNGVHPDVRRLVFMDDFCGSGQQATDFSLDEVSSMRQIAKRGNLDIEIWYLAILATASGLAHTRQYGVFDRVDTVSELDSSYRVFDNSSQFFTNAPSQIDKVTARMIASFYGQRLWPQHPLGYQDGQLLVGFHHNVPDNTLPIICQSASDPAWTAIFPRVN